MTQWFENIEIGEKHTLGQHTFEHDEIVRFGTAYDPQYFHIDDDAAEHSHFDGIIASGWHTACVGHRLLVDAITQQTADLIEAGETPGEAGPSPGVNVMEFKTPVRPGDTITYTFWVEAKRVSNSLPGWGVLTEWIEAHNQNGELVYKVQFAGFVKRRDYTPKLSERLALFAAQNPLLRRFLSGRG
ncbi:MAG: dehydratase [Hyphomicrobiaceae bacterium]|nr:dehydratase [Hyphomicrobiaceae bacterium]MCC0023295.1 dehydratase [Hyphomicrobiaceae bacterium]